jgi:PucR family transcriptional regulator, purine catabolism regulatory protein
LWDGRIAFGGQHLARSTKADFQEGPPEREAFFVVRGEAPTNAPAEYLAIAFASRDATAATRLRVSVAELVPDARVVRSRTGIVAALREVAGSVDTRALAEALRLRLARANDDDTLSAGVGGPKRGTTGAHLALLQAEQAVVIGRAMRGDGAVTMFEDLGPYCFVLGRPESDIREFADRTLGPLADGEQHADLVRTLDAYLRLHGSLNAVARDLYLHRNTVRQRLRRITKLTGADLKNADSRLALQLALLGRSALERLAS